MIRKGVVSETTRGIGDKTVAFAMGDNGDGNGRHQLVATAKTTGSMAEKSSLGFDKHCTRIWYGVNGIVCIQSK